MPDSPLVTIVTPSFNQGCFLRRTIDSVLNQTYPHIEYLVFDGGSTDESVDILRSYSQRFFWTAEKDRGQTHAVNKGMAQARGDILAYLNSDDVLFPTAVEKVVDHLGRHPEWDVVYGEADYIDADDGILARYPTHDFSPARLLQYCFLCQPATFWRASLARRIGPFNETLHCCMDYEYWLRMLRAGGRFARVPDLLAGSRIYATTKTMSLREKVYQETIRIHDEQAGFAEMGPFYGLWRHWCREKKTGWAGKLGWLPLYCPAMATLHYCWHNLGRAWPWDIVGGLWRGMRRSWAPRQSAV